MAGEKLPASLGLEHENPLPAGRYWVFRLGEFQIAKFDEWLARHRKQKVLQVLSSELDQEAEPVTAFVVFEVLFDGAVRWEGPGLPDRSPDHVTSSEDVINAPKVLEPAEQLEEAGKGVARAVARGAETIPLLLFAAGVIYLLTRNSKGTEADELYD
jgi:hypothetical protein